MDNHYDLIDINNKGCKVSIPILFERGITSLDNFLHRLDDQTVQNNVIMS